jgi:hypothetical protein
MKKPLATPRHSLEDRIEMSIQKVWSGDMGWIHLAQDKQRWQAVTSVVMKPRVA